MPEDGFGTQALDMLAPAILGGARRMDGPVSFDHMDPPTPWITWAMAMWNASLNQNLLHPDLSPVATEAEKTVIGWLSPLCGMSGGHMTPGSTVSNLTALWAAREVAGARRVVTSDAAHNSVRKAAHILGLDFESVPTRGGRLDPNELGDLSEAALVLTAGTTSTGVIDPLHLAGAAAWTHVDAAWAGPLVLTRHARMLDGIELADSVAVSGHKWLFQPKESALVLFREVQRANAALSYGGAYLTNPTIGVLGSRGAAAIPLMATLLAFGRAGLATRIEDALRTSDALYERLSDDSRTTTFAKPETGVLLWRPDDDIDRVFGALPAGTVSRTTVDGTPWLRNVAANPMADITRLWQVIDEALT